MLILLRSSILGNLAWILPESIASLHKEGLASIMPATIRIPHVSPLVDVTRPGGAESPPGSTGSGAAMDRKIRRRRWPPRRIAGAAAAALFAAFAAWGFLKDSGVRKLNVDRDRVTISEVVHGPFQEYTPVRGTVLPIRTVYLDALESGQVQLVFVEEGTHVAEGDPLLRVANPELELHVLQQESELQRRIEELHSGRLTMEQNLLSSRQRLMEIEYKAQIDRRNFERYASLSQEDLAAIMPLQDYEKLRDNYQFNTRKLDLTRETHRQDSLLAVDRVVQARSAVERMERNLEIIRRRLDGLTVRAPVSGQLTALDAEIGESKGSGTRLGKIDILDGFKVRAAIDEHYIARVDRGQRGRFDHDGRPLGLVIRKVYPEVQEGRFEVDLIFEDEAPAGIRRGQTLHIRLELGDLDQATQVARGGFYQATGGHWAYVLEPSGDRAVKRDIRLGRQNPKVYEVLEGLHPGERVITSGYEGFGEDMDVLVLK